MRECCGELRKAHAGLIAQRRTLAGGVADIAAGTSHPVFGFRAGDALGQHFRPGRSLESSRGLQLARGDCHDVSVFSRNSAAKMGAATDSALDSDGVGCETVGFRPQETQSGNSESHKQHTIGAPGARRYLVAAGLPARTITQRTSPGEPRRARGPTLAYPEQARCRMGALSTEARVNQARGGKGG